MAHNQADLARGIDLTTDQDDDLTFQVEAVNTEDPIEAELAASAAAWSGAAAWSAHHVRLSPWLRGVCLCFGIGSLTLLAIARSLTPSPLGHGTHQQLGLPPCTAVLLWNSPCPACGMTTSWALATRGDFGAAAHANIGGLLLAIIALAFFPASCYFFATGRATRSYWFSSLLTASLVTAMALAIVQWLVRLLS